MIELTSSKTIGNIFYLLSSIWIEVCNVYYFKTV